MGCEDEFAMPRSYYTLAAVEKHFRLQHSILDTQCKRFNGTTATARSMRCADCGHLASCHVVRSKTQESAIAVQLFCAVRNARCMTSAILALASASSQLTSSSSLKHLGASAMAMARQVAQCGARWKLRGKGSSSMVPGVCSVRLSLFPLIEKLQSASMPCYGL